MSYTGQWIEIDLNKQTHTVHPTDRSLLQEYIGGKGLGFAILDEIAPSPDPLGAENPLIFVNGPFTGTKVQTSARTTLVTRSPLTGSALDTHCGGHFGPTLKAAGYDYMIIRGRSEKPVYLHVSDESIQFLDASDLSGWGIFATEDELLSRHPGTKPCVAAIGPAGENLSRIACIGVNKHRQFGRGGAGAVMGSKQLKAIVVDGQQAINYHDEAAFKKANLALSKDVLNNPAVKHRRKKGTMMWIRQGQEMNFLPTRNFQKCRFDRWEELSSETARETLNWKDTGCFNCAIKCSKWARFDGHELEGPEYETTAFLGSSCEISDIKAVTIANELCNDLGIDTISAGSTCAFAMECYEKGLLEDTGGIELSWGNVDAQMQLLQQMARKEGIGKLFSDGSREAARSIGQGSEAFAMNTFGMELSGVNPKGALAMGFALAMADFASHTRLWITETQMGEDFKIEDIPKAVAKGLDEINVRNCLVICEFVPQGLGTFAEVLNAATGLNHTAESLLALGTKITHLARRYNLRNGRQHTDDTLPARFFDETSLSGLLEGKKLDRTLFDSLKQEYYALRGWNEKGEPPA